MRSFDKRWLEWIATKHVKGKMSWRRGIVMSRLHVGRDQFGPILHVPERSFARKYWVEIANLVVALALVFLSTRFFSQPGRTNAKIEWEGMLMWTHTMQAALSVGLIGHRHFSEPYPHPLATTLAAMTGVVAWVSIHIEHILGDVVR